MQLWFYIVPHYRLRSLAEQDFAWHVVSRDHRIACVILKRHGFSLELPNGRIVDLGTEFGVVVDDFGVSELGVFNGKVTAYQDRSSIKNPVDLVEGDALRWSAKVTTRFEVARRRFTRNALDLTDSDSPTTLVLIDDFDDNTLDSKKWTVLGHVFTKNGGLQLGRDEGEPEPGNVPYLPSNREFDPSEGAIVVTGKVAFSEPMHRMSGAVSIFTRAENLRGSFPRPDYGYLATGIRSIFWPVTTLRGEALRILVRPVESGENIGLLGEEFEDKHASSEWTFRLVDDGVNLALTIYS